MKENEIRDGNIRHRKKKQGGIVGKYHTRLGYITNIKTRSNSTTGYTGVSKRSKTGKYEAYISVEGKKKFLGIFDNMEDAVEAREKGVDEYYRPLAEMINEEINRQAIG